MRTHFPLLGSALAGWFLVSSAQAAVVSDKELLIRSLTVVEDATRTTNCGVWTFCHHMKTMAGRAKDPAALTLAWLNTWKSDRTISGVVVPKRTAIQQRVIDLWPKSGANLDLNKAPFRLLAIVNRIDLRNEAKGIAGEVHFVYGLTDGATRTQQMTVSIEYIMPIDSAKTMKVWANEWHKLGSFTSFGSAYNAQLEKVTQMAVAASVPGRPNNSPLAQIRTNETALASPWEMREFVLNANVVLAQTTTKFTPQDKVNNTADLANFVNANEAKILRGTYVLAAPIVAAGNAIASFGQIWKASGIKNAEARHKFSLNTCNGCHTSETSTSFNHILNRSRGLTAGISRFFDNVALKDGTGIMRNFNELNRRRQNFDALLTILAGSPNAVMPETGLTAQRQLANSDTPRSRIH